MANRKANCSILGELAWSGNPWIPDRNATFLSRRKYDRIEVTKLSHLAVTRIDKDRYSATIPTAAGYLEGHTVATLERLVIAILLNSPRLATGDRLGAPPSFSLRRPPKLRQIYLWHLTDHQAITGKVHGGDAEIVLRQYENGIHWKVAAQHQARKDASKLMKRLGGIIFEANARIHDYPWYVPKAKANRQVVQFLKQLPKKELRSAASPHLDQVVEKWIKKATQDEWVQGLQSQSPKQLWEHRNMIMTFQVWAIYRLATGQLRLHYSGAAWGSSCPQDSRVTARVSPTPTLLGPATGLRHSGNDVWTIGQGRRWMDLNWRASRLSLSARSSSSGEQTPTKHR
ncbi:hypothetical protein GQ600_12337 [Phytophthora cactorum]|nr:hypothetical protein GQ600_12337 [Phytophthora cactorum]